MTDWVHVLRALCPRANLVVDEVAPHLEKEFERGSLNTPERQAQFLANAAVETAGFTTLVEFGNDQYFRRYDGRKDLGNTKPGDGARFKGRGIFDLTGRANYAAEGKKLGVDLLANPELAATGQYATAIAVDYWLSHGCNDLADKGETVAIRRKINGGTNGLTQAEAYYARALQILNGKDATAEEPAAREKIIALQQRLKALNYSMVGKADGLIGSCTVAAISAFQHDHGLPVTGKADTATEAALWATEETRPLPSARTIGKPENSRIVKSASALIGGAVAVGTGAVAGEAAKVLTHHSAHLLEPAGIIAAAAAVWAVARRIIAARIEDYRTGKTP
jgi:predicted chitinase